jgi:phosphate uptake regulator
MDTRKVQKVGGSTYTVSVPKRWADEHQLEAGATVRLYTHRDGSLVVRDTETDGGHLAETRVDVTGGDADAVERALAAVYAVGFERATLVADDGFTDEQRRAVRRSTRRLAGVQVLEQSEGSVTVGHVLDADDVSVRQSVVQLQFVALATHRTATAAVTDGAPGEEVSDRSAEARRLTGLVTRHFNRALTDLREMDGLDVTRTGLFDYYRTAREFERVAGEAATLLEVGERVDDPLEETLATEVEAAAGDARRVVEDAAAAVLGGAGTAKAHAALDHRDAVLTDAATIEEAALDADTADAVLLRTLDCIRRTVASGGTIAETALRTAARRGEL